jgi:hypothetical protein
MTITTALSPARSHAFHTTLAAQQKRGGAVQFSLPPIQDASAPAGSSTPAVGAPAASGAGALSRNTLPIAVPVGAIAGLTPSVPATAAPPAPPVQQPFGKVGVTLPIAVPIAGGGGSLGTVTPLPPASVTPPPANEPGNPIVSLPIAPVSGIGTLSSQGNFLSAQLITRLYQRGG